jgi:hypothetical protein
MEMTFFVMPFTYLSHAVPPALNSRSLFSLTPTPELPSSARHRRRRQDPTAPPRQSAPADSARASTASCGQRSGRRAHAARRRGGWGRLPRTRLSSVQRGPGGACCLPRQCPAAVHQHECDPKSIPAQQMERSRIK